MKRKKPADPDSRTAELYEQERRKEEERALTKPDKERRKLLASYTDGLPYSRERVVGEAKKLLYQSFTSAIECGKYLIWAQAEEGVQTFGQILNQHFSHLPRSTAYNFMRLARVAVEHPKLQGMAERERSKVVALLEILDEEDLREFDETDSIAGMTLDEAERMPVRQLREELRKHKKKEERGKEQLREREERIEELEKEVHGLMNPKIYSDEEEKYHAIIADLGMRYEYILTDIKTKIGYDTKDIPQSAKKKLYYLLLYIQKETLEERLRLAGHYDGADDVPWEVDGSELPPDDELHRGVPHLEPIMKARDKKARGKGKRG